MMVGSWWYCVLLWGAVTYCVMLTPPIMSPPPRYKIGSQNLQHANPGDPYLIFARCVLTLLNHQTQEWPFSACSSWVRKKWKTLSCIVREEKPLIRSCMNPKWSAPRVSMPQANRSTQNDVTPPPPPAADAWGRPWGRSRGRGCPGMARGSDTGRDVGGGDPQRPLIPRPPLAGRLVNR